MRIERLIISTIGAASVAILFSMASVLLLVSVGFTFTAGETATNSILGWYSKGELERDANLAFGLFALLQVAIVSLAVRSGALPGRLHWAIKATGALVVSVATSCALVLLAFSRGGLGGPFVGVERSLATWIRSLV